MNDQPAGLPQEVQTSPTSANGNKLKLTSGASENPSDQQDRSTTPISAKVEPIDEASLHESTGPRTPQGKERSKFNARKHGIFSKAVLLENDSRAEYYALLNGLMEDFQPQGKLETVLVENLATLMWRKRRLLQAETAEIEKARFDHEEIRRLAGLDDHALEVEAPKREHNFAGSHVPPQEVSDRLVRYEAHLTREMDRVLNRLERLQRTRKGQPLPPQVDVKIS